MSPKPENPQALADTAAYAEELKAKGVPSEIVDFAGFGFLRGRMVNAAQIEAACAGFYSDRQGLIDWKRMSAVDPRLADKYREGLAAAFRAAGFTVPDSPP